ncbi:hypothetical protein RI570_06635 [Brucella pseudogrignonensis]|uniref:hypothetical protein n=1 Tax=Brucella pseudogrignonensis TaxID=419475 RepID=UPI0028B9F7AA|nr:hypothetical protein [Brucella pseudogrignonensis]MDT6939820.1 hypothetical protein [Brucella pseudogrignonensis]
MEKQNFACEGQSIFILRSGAGAGFSRTTVLKINVYRPKRASSFHYPSGISFFKEHPGGNAQRRVSLSFCGITKNGFRVGVRKPFLRKNQISKTLGADPGGTSVMFIVLVVSVGCKKIFDRRLSLPDLTLG